jgi:hypothetical protein
MPLTLNEYREKLIKKILGSDSQEAVKRFIDFSIKLFEQNDIHVDIIDLFVEKTISELELFSPMEKDSGQWRNIQLARILLNRKKNR